LEGELNNKISYAIVCEPSTFSFQVSMLCSVTGSVLVVGGLYLLLWGKIKETQMKQSKETQMKQIEVFSEDSVQCETIHFTNPSLACCQRDQDKKIVTSVTSCSPSTISTITK